MRTTISAVKADIGGIGGHTRPSDQLIEAANMPVCIHFVICSPISLILLLLSCSYPYWYFSLRGYLFLPDQTPRFCPSFESLFLL
ncbi:MAG: fructose 1,6-bisphosphatase, partial [Nitrososphaeraceae archaeon]